MSKIKSEIIDLSDQFSPRANIFSSIGEAKVIEHRFDIQRILVMSPIKVDIIFPESLMVLGRGAFQTLFEGAIRRLGEKKFRSKINIIAHNSFINSFNDWVYQITKEIVNDEPIKNLEDAIE